MVATRLNAKVKSKASARKKSNLRPDDVAITGSTVRSCDVNERRKGNHRIASNHATIFYLFIFHAKAQRLAES